MVVVQTQEATAAAAEVTETRLESASEEEDLPSTTGNRSQGRLRSSLAQSSVVQSTKRAYFKIDNAIDAYEREPVPKDRFKGWISFLGLFTSRHTAGTEFAIGPLFVARGSTAIDIVVGLFIGNLLATLSWRFVCAPLAVSQRLTAYYAMERAFGRRFLYVYDVLACVLLAGLAGAMFTVSATAFAAMFNVDAPELTDLLPTSGAFCGLVIACGLVTTVVAAFGFTFVTMFGQFMTPVLIAGIIFFAVESLRMLGIGQDGCGLWCILSETVYTGVVVEEGIPRFGFAHCVFFAWWVDLQLHIAQNDLTLLRFAHSANVGWTSAGGMFIGHYFAWIVAGCMYAVQLQTAPTNTSVAPGPIAELVGGTFGLVIIIIAGWSTANPVIYSSGLALQHIFPKVHAWMSTIIVGLVATAGRCYGLLGQFSFRAFSALRCSLFVLPIFLLPFLHAVACFPAVTNGIIEFLAFAGLLQCPFGVMLFIDYFCFPRLGLEREFPYRQGKLSADKDVTNWPAVITFVIAETISLPLCWTPVSVYFAPAITISLSAILYIGITKWFVRKGMITYDNLTCSPGDPGKDPERHHSAAAADDEMSSVIIADGTNDA